MRVSVVIPCFRDSATLGRALDSVLDQSRPADEIIVVNDASPETKEIESVLAAYPQVKYIVNATNLGLAATRNVGVRVTSADIVSFLDADDELHPQKIELQLSLFRPESAVSSSISRIGGERGVDRVVNYQSQARFSVFQDSSQLIRRNRLTGASIMVSRELFLSLGGYDETLRSCEDFDLWLRLLDKGITVLNVELPLYLYRCNENGLSRNLLNISRWELEVVRKYYERHRSAQGQTLREAVTFGMWLFKHQIRCEQCRDPRLIEATRRNLDLVSASPFVRALLLVAQRIRLAWIVHRLLSAKDSLLKLVHKWHRRRNP